MTVVSSLEGKTERDSESLPYHMAAKKFFLNGVLMEKVGGNTDP